MAGPVTPIVARQFHRLLDAGSRRLDFGWPGARVILALLALAAVTALGTAAWLAHVDAGIATETAAGPTLAYDGVAKGDPCDVVVPAALAAGPNITVSAAVSPIELRPKDRYQQEFRLTNRGRNPVTVESISMTTYQNGRLLRSTPGWFNPARHAGTFRPGPVPPGAQECLVYRAPGEYTRESGCGEMKARFTLHTSEGDLVASAAWRGVCE